MGINVGVDIAGMNNSWVTVLDSNKSLIQPPSLMNLEDILNYCLKNKAVTVTIDAPLSYAIDEENGMRDCDMRLRQWLKMQGFPEQYVLSSNSLQAVTSRGRLLAEELLLSDFKGLILETVPRFCLAQMAVSLNNPNLIQAVQNYKNKDTNISANSRRDLWNDWCSNKLMTTSTQVPSFNKEKDDGKVDSMVCATIGYFFSTSNNLVHLESHNPKKPNTMIRGFVKGIHILA
ncbi:DUF429 domain-containing protein [Brevibacillus borstelensis]|uniref:DUF429 domain-containing protein n=1 Tax=Brevibacillus borstelensis TaxID=45462 RepID=UPI0020417B3B|nr:DUF429 domain-containing protein [Brevibacillus borstelensis]MCM3593475.1 DUF429 domain-containing protein [Brevibacillus borstelensis]